MYANDVLEHENWRPKPLAGTRFGAKLAEAVREIDLANQPHAIADMLRLWRQPFTRADVLVVLMSTGLTKDDATAVLSTGIARGILREEDGFILATVEHPSATHSPILPGTL